MAPWTGLSGAGPSSKRADRAEDRKNMMSPSPDWIIRKDQGGCGPQPWTGLSGEERE